MPRRRDPGRDSYSVAEEGKAGLDDGGPALPSELNAPTGVAVAPSGAILVLDIDWIRAIYDQPGPAHPR